MAEVSTIASDRIGPVLTQIVFVEPGDARKPAREVAQRTATSRGPVPASPSAPRSPHARPASGDASAEASRSSAFATSSGRKLIVVDASSHSPACLGDEQDELAERVLAARGPADGAAAPASRPLTGRRSRPVSRGVRRVESTASDADRPVACCRSRHGDRPVELAEAAGTVLDTARELRPEAPSDASGYLDLATCPRRSPSRPRRRPRASPPRAMALATRRGQRLRAVPRRTGQPVPAPPRSAPVAR